MENMNGGKPNLFKLYIFHLLIKKYCLSFTNKNICFLKVNDQNYYYIIVSTIFIFFSSIYLVEDGYCSRLDPASLFSLTSSINPHHSCYCLLDEKNIALNPYNMLVFYCMVIFIGS